MDEFFKKLNQEIQEYLKILSPQFPEWLLDYIDTPEMQRLDKVGMSCGTFYTKVYDDKGNLEIIIDNYGYSYYPDGSYANSNIYE